MQKIQKRITLLLTLIVAFFICSKTTDEKIVTNFNEIKSMSYLAENDSVITKSAFENAYNLDQSDTCYGIVKLNGVNVITDEGTPNVWATGMWGGAKDVTGYNWVNITNSNPSVATASYKTEGGKLIITFTPGTKSGTTKISVGVDAKYPHDTLGTWNMELNFDYTVTNTVSGGGTTEVKPEKPTIDDIPSTSQNGYVFVKCKSYPNANPLYNSTRTHAGYMSFKNSTEGWEFSEVYQNDGRFGEDAPAADYPWLSDLIIDSEWYLEQYNKNYATKEGTHYLADEEITIKVTFVSDGTYWYFFEDDFPITVWTTHTAPATSYTIIHQYYINGKKEGEISSKETSTVGATINANDITKQTTYNGKNYNYVFTSPESVKLTATIEENVITLKYEREEKYTIIYTDGLEAEEIFPNQKIENLEEGVPTPKFTGTPTREGYIFKGWTPEIKETVNPADADENGIITYTAVWEKENSPAPHNDYVVIYQDGVNGNLFDNQSEKGLIEGASTPKFAGTPTREGYIFKGWTPEIKDTIDPEDADENGVITYTATWEPIEENPLTSDNIIIVFIPAIIFLFITIVLCIQGKKQKRNKNHCLYTQ